MIYESFKYEGGEHFFRKNFIMYNGRQETTVIMKTFHMNA